MGDDRSTLRNIISAFLLMALSASLTGAQLRRTTQTGDLPLMREKIPVASTLPAPTPALESIIDPDHYYVGPSDGFDVNVWTDPPLSTRITVTPEGTLIVPGVGEIRVGELPLSEARKRILTEIKRRYRFSECSVTLVAPRSVVVSVQGRVLNAGSFVLPAYSRVDKAIEEANKLQAFQTFDEAQWIRSQMSTRRVTVRHRNGTQDLVDLKRFLALRDDRYNPYLREGDIIVVPTTDFMRDVFGVYGFVNAPGKYEYTDGDGVRGALQIAFGFSPRAIQDSVELIRQDEKGETSLRRILNGRDILSGAAADVPLEAGDRLVVRGETDLRADYTVTIRGQVRNPGVYPITRESTRLTDVIASAGGFMEDASLVSAELIRRSVAQGEIETERLQSLRGGVPVEDSTYYYLETQLRLRKETVYCDFASLFQRGDSSQNVLIRDGDLILVPTAPNTIYVFGQVVSPGHIQFKPGENVEYYLRMAGGATDRARESDIKIVKAKTRQWLSADDSIVEEGDYVWVPKEVDRPFGYVLNVIAQSAAILTAAVSVALLAVQLNK
ncbi:MAG TPA: SLBB domain-containing protein [Bacteroidota bacterium]|nr:SLBB domain-containing protein [Bacteroidota bacterium]